jgi:HAD superfamily hydrolase (TIGR01490 family)
MIAALFDIEGTLFTNPMGWGFMKYASANGRGIRAAAYFASFFPQYCLTKINLLSRETVNSTAIARMPWFIQGYDLRQAEKMFHWVADEFILPSGRESVLERWEHHRRLGHLLLIASGGLAPCVRRIGERLQAAGTAGTEAAVEHGRYTGRISSPVVIGREKADRTRALVSELGVEVDWRESFAYADSYHDLPFMELTGHPVAVHPDAELKRVALERGWMILDGG